MVKIKNEWFCYSSEEEIDDLLSKLSEKGFNEKNLITNINKILVKKLKVTKIGAIIENDLDNNQIILKKALEWKNHSVGINKIKHNLTTNLNKLKKISDVLISLEEKLSNYLGLQDKEWESKSNREDFVNY